MEIKDGWINVKKAMPTDATPILCVVKGEVFIGMYMARLACWYSTDWYHNEHNAEFEVTHWMSLPTPPKK